MKLSFAILAAVATATAAVASPSPIRLLTDAPANAGAQPPIEIHSFRVANGAQATSPCHNKGAAGSHRSAWESLLSQFGVGPKHPFHEEARDRMFLGKPEQDAWWRKMKHVKEEAVGIMVHPPSPADAHRHGWVAIDMSEPGHPQVPGNGRHAPHPHFQGHHGPHGHHHGKTFMQRLARAADQLTLNERLAISFMLGAGITITLFGVLMALAASFRGSRARRQRAIQLSEDEAPAALDVDEKRPIQ